jgi:hypothetical protein
VSLNERLTFMGIHMYSCVREDLHDSFNLEATRGFVQCH